jgi:predicted dinucleotide-binding enzyme
MRIAMLGTGGVGRTLGTKLVSLGHEVRMGSRTAGGVDTARLNVAVSAGPSA